MKKIAILAAALTLGALATGCGDDKKDATPPAQSGAAAATQKASAMPAAANSAAPATTAAVASNDDIPSEADFEDEAEKDITADNVDSDLDKLEKEIGQ